VCSSDLQVNPREMTNGAVLNALTPEQAEILSHMSIEYLDDGQGGMVKTIRLTGANFQVVNGLGATATVNGTGSFFMRAERVGRDTLLAQIVQMVSEAQRSRAPIQRLADVVSGYFVPAVLGAALLTFAGWALWGPDPRLSYAMISAVAVLIIACPCALGLATPMSIMVGIGRGARQGILIRDAAALETLGKVDVLLIDKTGTLTEGKPRVTKIAALEPYERADILHFAASIERASEHALARAVVSEARAQEVELADVEDFTSVPGHGIAGRVDGRFVMLGNAAHLQSRDVATDALEDLAAPLRADGATAVLIALDDVPAGVIAVADSIKETTPAALQRLREAGLRIVIASVLAGEDPPEEGTVVSVGVAEVEFVEVPASGQSGEVVLEGRAGTARRRLSVIVQ